MPRSIASAAALLLLAGATWFHWLGITPAFSTLP